MAKAPQIISRFANDSRPPRWWSLRFDKKTKPDADEPTKPDAKNIEALLSAVNSTSQHVRNFYITFLLAGIYIAIIIWSTTDMMLLKETPVNLPLLNAELPITGFYRFAPFFYLLVHFNLLLQLCLLSDKLHGYNAALLELADKKAREYYDIRLFPFVFSHTLSGTQHSWVLKILLTGMVWITMIWLPLCLLIGLQVGFLAFHSEQVLELQRWAIVADLGILILFWPIIRSPDGKWITWVMRAIGISAVLSWVNRRFSPTTVVRQPEFLCLWMQRFNTSSSGMPILEGILSFITLMVVISFSWGVAVLPDSDNEAWVAKKVVSVAQWLDSTNEIVDQGEADEQVENPAKFVDAWLSERPLKEDGKHYFRLTEYLFDWAYQKNYSGRKLPRDSIFHRNLRLREKLLIANKLKPEDIARLTDNGKKVQEEVLNKIVGLDLKGRDLRYADFSRSLMPKVDFRKINGVSTKLDYVNFKSAKLYKARMMGTQLQGAYLDYAKLQDAYLTQAMLQGAKLNNAELQGANLEEAQLQDAKLSRAQLQGVNMNRSRLQGADLSWAKLQGVNLNEAQLQGAILYRAQLQGAKLFRAQLQVADLRAQLQGVDLREAQLQGANLTGADLQGADLIRAKLQGAKLTEARFQGADLGWASLQGADLFRAVLQGTRLTGARLQGAGLTNAQLQGADLTDAQLQGTELNAAQFQGADLSKANLAHSNITDANFGKMSEQESKDLFKEMSQLIKNPRRLKALQDRLSKATKRTITLAKAQGQNIWVKEPDEVQRKAFKESLGGLEVAKSVSDYHNGLLSFLIELSVKNKWVVHGIIHHRSRYSSNFRPLESSFALCLLSLKDKENKSGVAIYPGLSENSKKDIRDLKRMASRTEPKNNIQAIFNCENSAKSALNNDLYRFYGRFE